MKKNGFWMPPHPLANFEIKKYYENEPRFNGICSRNSLPKKGWRICNKPWWICRCRHTFDCFFFNKSEIVYFDSFGVEHAAEEIIELAGNKNIIANIFRVQANNSVMCGYFCIGFTDFMLAGKKLTNFKSMFCPYDFEKNDDTILSYSKDEWNWENKFDWRDKVRLNKVIEIENYFHQEINQRKSCSK